MSLATALGGIAIAEHLFAQTLAGCSQWIADTDAADATEALESIYFHTLPPPENRDRRKPEEFIALRPFAVVSTRPFSGGYGWNRIGADAWDDFGQLELTLEYNVPQEMADDNSALMRWFENKLGNILRPDSTISGQESYVGLTDFAHDAGYLAINSIGLFGTNDDPAIGRANELFGEDCGDFVSARFLVNWGVSG